MTKDLSGAGIRNTFIEFFKSKGHKFVPSSSLVPGGDQTLLFTNAGMVQFKDVFLGTDHRDYKRAVNSQKCMRVAGKHNDLDDVGRDNSHHTFFEMLGNWSFGDYYKKEAIAWAWELLTDVWEINKSKLWVTCFKDEKGEIETDSEAYDIWQKQPGIFKEQILYFGRKDNFWEMAEVGPCGPCSEIHVDLGLEFCDKKDDPNHKCQVNGDCSRFLELWNLVFIQYNRIDAKNLEPLPARHVDTGMGFERIVSYLQKVYSNYKTDLLSPLLDKVQELTSQTNSEREEYITPYRVIADHARSSTFLIADGVVPGNTGRNYVCRMIIRRAARLGTKIGLNEPFLAKIAEKVIEIYASAYPELLKNKKTILDNITREEKRFKRTLETGLTYLDEMLVELNKTGKTILDGDKAFELYATHGLPFEITRDIAKEKGLDVDFKGFQEAMDSHRLASGAGKAFGNMGGENAEFYSEVLNKLVEEGFLSEDGVEYNPYEFLNINTELISMFIDGSEVNTSKPGEDVQVILPKFGFYIESGGQVYDTGLIKSIDENNKWEIKVFGAKKPSAGVIVIDGKVIEGTPKVGDKVQAIVDIQRRKDIMRNHTATHLLHAELQKILGSHARQAGSLVAPDRLRFDFTHPEAVSREDLDKIEVGVNKIIHSGYPLNIKFNNLEDALSEGAMALFGEKYSDYVRTVSIGSDEWISYELCGGTHVENTSDIGMFIITSESSAAAGVRRIEAVTGRGAYNLIRERNALLTNTAQLVESPIEDLENKTENVLKQIDDLKKELSDVRQKLVMEEFTKSLDKTELVNDISVLSDMLPGANMDTLRTMTDIFRNKYDQGVIVLGSVVNNRPILVASVSQSLIKKGFNAGDIVKHISKIIGGSGGGKPNLAQAGGKDPEKLTEALSEVVPYIKNKYLNN